MMINEVQYIRDHMIMLGIYSIGYVCIAIDYFFGKNVNIEPLAFYLLTGVFMLGWIFLIRWFRHAKRKGRELSYEAVIEKIEEESVFRKNKVKYRTYAIWYLFLVGLAFSTFLSDWEYFGIRCEWLGYLFMVTGILALLGVNIFIGGPLDRRTDD